MTSSFSHTMIGIQNTTAWAVCVLVVALVLWGVCEFVGYALDCLAAHVYLAPPRAAGPTSARRKVQ